MRSEVLVALLVTGVFWDEVEVLAADDEGSVHLGGDDSSGEDTATDRDFADEWALLVCEARNVSSCSVRISPNMCCHATSRARVSTFSSILN